MRRTRLGLYLSSDAPVCQHCELMGPNAMARLARGASTTGSDSPTADASLGFRPAAKSIAALVVDTSY